MENVGIAPPDTPVFTVLLMFDCPAAERDSLMDQFFAFIEEHMRSQPGFISALIYATEAGDKIVEHFQWRDRAAYESYRRSSQGKQAAEWLLSLQPQTYYLELAHAIVA
ncbi:MAG: antibiotic biosynthesis monooxygenase [Gammaproteobacteria bacterium]|nr:antibiotic biosynthesis monooxygenase [Gammaproteobacteria bacterium]MCP5424336.1 antibiotic biosynthesis monooxygenase [Gammaproteobacteria bacterium]MCP5459090.1 antibiotic biosynthesis monooxygenase [Gammaproteobacteria bacterium]